MKCAISDTVEYVKRMAQDLAGCEPNYAMVAILLDLTFPTNYDGFEYLKNATLLQFEDPSLDLVNDIYCRTGVKYGNIGPDVVASAIRRATAIAWERGNTEIWNIYLPTVLTNDEHPPTNVEVITGLARILELWYGCSQAYLRQQLKEVVSSGRA